MLRNKLALAVVSLCLPFHVYAAAMQELTDQQMSGVTGQAGVTIEIDIDSSGVSVGEVEYQDEGSVILQNIQISDVNNLTQTIDVDSSGNLIIAHGEVAGVQLLVGDTAADADGKFSAVALKSAAGEVAELVNDIALAVDLGVGSTTIINMAETVGNAALIADLPVAARSGSVAIRSSGSLEITNFDMGLFGYTALQAADRAGINLGGQSIGQFSAAAQSDLTQAQGQLVTAQMNLGSVQALLGSTQTTLQNAVAANGFTVAFAADGSVQEIRDAGNAVIDIASSAYSSDAAAVNSAASDVILAGGVVTGAQQGVDDANAVVGAAGLAGGLANGAAVKVRGLKLYGATGVGSKAVIEQTIWAKGGDAANGGGVYINIGRFDGTLDVAAVEVGGASLGAIKVSGIDLSGMTQRIYGH
ncbi:DUF6160 family protein [Thalassolituus pacificus]|uniref:DUF6160 domain-containing protein n=1 Tax=Thalassolituus pacificus TaxID=2975440 RepID=A0A9X2WGT0_9GAMM|nr:DUF6160 family protein [Thalassolituus pacificus]MCT7359785.1 hypothetical protein [Thalassolituus pacificus]